MSNKKKGNKANNKKKVETVVNKKEVDKSFVPYYFLIAGIIIMIFGFIYGFKILNPSNTGWIFASETDILQHYVGWEAFRYGDWTFPIGLTDTVSYPLGVSVIYTDAIPIVALFLKLISFMLPKTFQYLGLYGLLCFVLQGIFSAKIIRKFTDSKINIIVVSILFSIIPSMIFRMFYHTSLASQWLLLLSLETIFLYNDFKDGKKIYYIWGLISFLTSTIHIYYLLMCGIILTGYLLFDILNTKKLKKSIILLLIYLGVALLSIWIFGGFVNLGTNDGFGFGLGLFSYNLNGLINSQGWSVFIEELPMNPYQYEGFAYLGLGVIILIIISIILTIIWFIKDRGIIKRHKNLIISLTFVCLVCVFVAASPVVYLGDNILYELELPSFVISIWEVFRSTGRIVWPVIHILTLLSVIIILKRLSWKYSLLILSLCTFIQIVDIGAILSDIHSYYIEDYEITEEYDISKNEYLNIIANNDDIELLVLASDDMYDSDLFLYADWALNNNMKTNNFHFARTSFDDILTENSSKFLEEINETKAYVFTSKKQCTSYGLHCYELPRKHYVGYINELS